MTKKIARIIAGVDEVGRGPLAGDVVTAAVILDDNHTIEGLNDSKKLSAKRRRELSLLIREHAVAWTLSRASVEEIDALNILQASLLAMKRAVESLAIQPDYVFVDGNKLPDWTYASEAVVQGDGKIDAISAASILAKVCRDDEMVVFHEQYPQYGFDRHKGYPTKAHIQALKAHGPCEIHRRSFAPVSSL